MGDVYDHAPAGWGESSTKEDFTVVSKSTSITNDEPSVTSEDTVIQKIESLRREGLKYTEIKSILNDSKLTNILAMLPTGKEPASVDHRASIILDVLRTEGDMTYGQLVDHLDWGYNYLSSPLQVLVAADCVSHEHRRSPYSYVKPYDPQVSVELGTVVTSVPLIMDIDESEVDDIVDKVIKNKEDRANNPKAVIDQVLELLYPDGIPVYKMDKVLEFRSQLEKFVEWDELF